MKDENLQTHQALRDAGFVPLPRLWIKAYDMPRIHAIAEQYKDEVMEIRHRMRRLRAESLTDLENGHNPQENRDDAWDVLGR